MRSTCSVFCGLSIDGFIARPDGALDFLEGDGSAEMGDHGYEAFMAGIDALVMGRRTFEVVMGFDAMAVCEKGLRAQQHGSVDLSPLHATRGGDVELLNATPDEVVTQLAARGFRNLYIDGGATVQRFLRAGLIDRLIVTHVPVLIGQGVRLFGCAGARHPYEAGGESQLSRRARAERVRAETERVILREAWPTAGCSPKPPPGLPRYGWHPAARRGSRGYRARTETTGSGCSSSAELFVTV
jgi:dihydrofolate reductase